MNWVNSLPKILPWVCRWARVWCGVASCRAAPLMRRGAGWPLRKRPRLAACWATTAAATRPRGWTSRAARPMCSTVCATSIPRQSACSSGTCTAASLVSRPPSLWTVSSSRKSPWSCWRKELSRTPRSWSAVTGTRVSTLSFDFAVFFLYIFCRISVNLKNFTLY